MNVVKPGGGHEDEYSYIPAGPAGTPAGDHEIVARPGGYRIKPRGPMPTSCNAGPGPACILKVIAPAGFERILRRIHRDRCPGVPPGSGDEARHNLLRGRGRGPGLRV